MDKRIVSLLGAAAAMTAVTGAQAAPAQQMTLTPPTSYNDLLEPIPNAVALLKADDVAQAEASSAAGVELVQYYYHHHHHYRRHHHHYRRPYYRFIPPYFYRRPRHHHHHYRYR